jgi:hypothetical protein
MAHNAYLGSTFLHNQAFRVIGETGSVQALAPGQQKGPPGQTCLAGSDGFLVCARAPTTKGCYSVADCGEALVHWTARTLYHAAGGSANGMRCAAAAPVSHNALAGKRST